MKNNGFRIVLTAMFASMVCVSTICIRIPSPTGGYINLGDALVLMSAFLLGPVYGGAAAGIGSGLADLFSGYVTYAPGTLIVKLLVAVIAAHLFRMLAKRASKLAMPLRCVIAAIPAELVMVAGYLLYEWVFLGYGAAAAGEIFGNLAQGTAGVAISAALTPVLTRPREIRDLLEKFNTK